MQFQRFFASGPIHVDDLTVEERQAMQREIQTRGFAVTPRPILADDTRRALHFRYESLFRGDFETGVYPDEWHWRQGLSLPHVTREICNAYKSDRLVASVVLHPRLAALAAKLQGWSSVRMGQDDVIWKPPIGVPHHDSRHPHHHHRHRPPKTTVGYHQDAQYISTQFEPYNNNMVTVWMALDDADEETGCVEYVFGSHLWKPNHSATEESSSTLTFFSNKDNEGDEKEEENDGLPNHRNPIPGDLSKQEIVCAKCPAGHAIFHHQDVWHGSGPNQSTTRHRRALVAHLLNGNVQWKQQQSQQPNSKTTLPPWTDTTYIYGRYRRSGTRELDEDFFPILYASPESGKTRTPWLETYLDHV